MAEDSKNTQIAKLAAYKQSLMAAAAATGSGGGGQYLKVDDRTGALTIGANRDPFPTKYRYMVDLGSFAHGYIVFGEPGGTREVVVSMLEQPVRPVPVNGYAERFGDPGAKDCTRIVLTCLDEPGDRIKFDALGKSNVNRVRFLLEETIAHMDTEAGAAGFVHPVVKVFASSYFHREQGRDTNHVDFEVVDWSDGGRLWSEAAPQDGPAAEAPWTAEEPRQAPKRGRPRKVA